MAEPAPGPQRDAPGGHGPPDDDVSRLAKLIANDVAKLEEDTIQALLPALLDARKELQRDLTEWLKGVDGRERYTAQAHRRGLVAIESALGVIAQMRPELQHELLEAMKAGGELAGSHLRMELQRFGDLFGESIRPTQISTAAIIARAKDEIIPRIRSSSARYVDSVRKDMRHQLAIGLAKGETFTQLTNRLRRLGGPRGLVALRGIAGEPGAHVEDIAEGLFARYRHWAERVVRTEVINAYNIEHQAGIEEINATRDPDEDELLQKWDSSPDRRRCEWCASLEGKTAKIGKPFPGGILRPPAHPNCRCVVVAWHPSWGDQPGEHRPPKEKYGPKKPRASSKAAPAAPGSPGAPGGKKPRTADGQAIAGFAKGDLKNGRRSFDSFLKKQGFAPSTATNGNPDTLEMKLPDGVWGQHNTASGRIALSPRSRQLLEEFSKTFAADPAGAKKKLRELAAARRKTGRANPPGHVEAYALESQARGMHVLVHETLHGFGPTYNSQYEKKNAAVEEVTTEVLARAVMRDRYGINPPPDYRIPAYNTEIKIAADALRDHFGLTDENAMKLLEQASAEFKRTPMPPSIVGAPEPLEHLANAIVKLRPDENVAKIHRLLQRRIQPLRK
jgi:hypothetical protein